VRSLILATAALLLVVPSAADAGRKHPHRHRHVNVTRETDGASPNLFQSTVTAGRYQPMPRLPLRCRSPQVLNSAGTGCVTPLHVTRQTNAASPTLFRHY
jgi:type VI protein secretion system component Hcp